MSKLNQIPKNNISSLLKSLLKNKFERQGKSLSLSLSLSLYLACLRLFSEFMLLCNNIILSQISVFSLYRSGPANSLMYLHPDICPPI